MKHQFNDLASDTPIVLCAMLPTHRYKDQPDLFAIPQPRGGKISHRLTMTPEGAWYKALIKDKNGIERPFDIWSGDIASARGEYCDALVRDVPWIEEAAPVPQAALEQFKGVPAADLAAGGLPAGDPARMCLLPGDRVRVYGRLDHIGGQWGTIEKVHPERSEVTHYGHGYSVKIDDGPVRIVLPDEIDCFEREPGKPYIDREKKRQGIDEIIALGYRKSWRDLDPRKLRALAAVIETMLQSERNIAKHTGDAERLAKELGLT